MFAALEAEASDFSREHGIACSLVIDDDEPELSKLVSMNIYRIFQESLANVYKHARATKVTAELTCQNNRLTLIVTDNGIGIPEAGNGERTFGITGMKERAELMHGSLYILPVKPSGTKVKLIVPVLSERS